MAKIDALCQSSVVRDAVEHPPTFASRLGECIIDALPRWAEEDNDLDELRVALRKRIDASVWEPFMADVAERFLEHRTGDAPHDEEAHARTSGPS